MFAAILPSWLQGITQDACMYMWQLAKTQKQKASGSLGSWLFVALEGRVHCAVHLLKAGFQSSMGAMGLLAPPEAHRDDAAVRIVA